MHEEILLHCWIQMLRTGHALILQQTLQAPEQDLINLEGCCVLLKEYADDIVCAMPLFNQPTKDVRVQ